MARIERRNSVIPGARLVVELDIAELSLPVLLAGLEQPERVWLVEEAENRYSLHAIQRLGDMRKQPGKPAPDLMVELVNEFADELDADEVPQSLRDRWDALVDRYRRETVPASR